MIYLKRGIAHALNNFKHKQYTSNNLDQNNSIHGVYIIICEGNVFLLCFGMAMQYPSKVQ
jgi:TPP-dependent trihydroxycyclohexane-1,2-dione (THcHDO) dehydratase